MTSAEAIVWTAFADWLGRMGFWFKSGEGLEMQERLFAAPRQPVKVPEVNCSWLRPVGLLGKRPCPSQLVAYRLDLIHQRFGREPWPTMNELLALASAAPGKVRTLRAVRQRRQVAAVQR